MPGRTWHDPALPLEERVDALVADLTAEERARIALGEFDSLVARGVPAPEYVDSGTGLRGVSGATAFPAGIALAATFDPELAEAYGAAVGEEARSAGFTVVLGPTLDLARDPRGGRIPEALGEDPYLSGLIGAAHVRGLQGRRVIAQLKHFVAYNSEERRTGYGLGAERGDAVDVEVSEATLHDTYLRPFEAAVEAGAWSMMGSYNRINGVYACESADILSIPRRDWGWRGFSCPDFLFAVRDDEAALAAGLDLPALGGAAGRTAEMVERHPAEAADAVANLVRALIGVGLVEDPVGAASVPLAPGHGDLAERVAIAASVLLRNEGQALPFGTEVRSVAVIGPSGTDALYVTGGSAAVDLEPGRVVTPLDGLRAAAGDRTVVAAQGSWGDVPLPTVPAAVLQLPDGSGAGVLVESADGAVRVADNVDHAVPVGTTPSSWPSRWRTRLVPRATGRHRLSLDLGGRASVRVDGRTVMVGAREASPFLHGPHLPLQAVVDLVVGRPVELEIDYEPGPAIFIPPMGIAPVLRLGWREPDGLIDEAAAVAADCDAAVVIVNQASGEGMDRDSLALPGDQDDLVRRVAAANPRTIVVLNTPGAVELPWLDEVAAVLQVWYPGERFGAALGAMLFGEAEPGGRLPLTFPHDRADLPGGDHGPEVVVTTLDYDADGGIGYRAPGVRERGCEFGFGHGLGYAATSCEVTGCRQVDGRLRVALAVTNPDARDTVHVAQAYAAVAGAVPELVAVVRVPVAAGSTASAEFELGAGAFARWDPTAGRRVPVDGQHQVLLGSGSLNTHSEIDVIIDEGIPAASGWVRHGQ
ncbi:MAG: glycoside hydrolase family 3 C-terminal domain-containing protein [Propionicimonas sp.]|uniref:glycoside hydrolase family 3 C-terminal domain-containing protein n=1 Tax=Propionicimonas sp. TaxID=1955623 RepID=UPI003D0B269F